MLHQLDRTLAFSERMGSFAEGEIFDEPQDDNILVVRLQLPHRAFHGFHRKLGWYLKLGGSSGGKIFRVDGIKRGFVPFCAIMVDDLVPRNLVEPARERVS